MRVGAPIERMGLLAGARYDSKVAAALTARIQAVQSNGSSRGRAQNLIRAGPQLNTESPSAAGQARNGWPQQLAWVGR